MDPLERKSILKTNLFNSGNRDAIQNMSNIYVRATSVHDFIRSAGVITQLFVRFGERMNVDMDTVEIKVLDVTGDYYEIELYVPQHEKLYSIRHSVNDLPYHQYSVWDDDRHGFVGLYNV